MAQNATTTTTTTNPEQLQEAHDLIDAAYGAAKAAGNALVRAGIKDGPVADKVMRAIALLLEAEHEALDWFDDEGRA